jgi:hypothetical protein
MIEILSKKPHASKKSGRQIRKKTKTTSIVTKPAFDARKRKIHVSKEAPKQT